MSKVDKKSKQYYSDESDEEKETKKQKKKAQKQAAKVAALLGYTNDTNPFGDSNLLQPFVWGKKIEKEKKTDKKSSSSSSSNHYSSNKEEDVRMDLLDEISRVRKRREDREKELEEMDRLRSEEQRLRESALYGDYEEKEESFHMDQTRVRSIIRLSEQRETVIDVLAKNVLLLDSCHADTLGVYTTDMDGKTKKASAAAVGSNAHGSTGHELNVLKIDPEIRDPITILESSISTLSQLLSTSSSSSSSSGGNNQATELDQLLSDIDSYIQYSKKHDHHHPSIKGEKANNGEGVIDYVSYWEDIKHIVLYMKKKYKIKSSYSSSSSSSSHGRGSSSSSCSSTSSSSSLHRSVASAVEEMLHNKSMYELELLQVDIQSKISKISSSSAHRSVGSNNASALSIEGDRLYWEEILYEIKYEKSKMNVLRIHKLVLQQVLNYLKAIKQTMKNEQQQQIQQQRLDKLAYAAGNEGGDEDYDYKNEIKTKTEVVNTSSSSSSSTSQQPLPSIQAMDKDEEKMGMSDEIILPGQTYLWGDKYRPRKPRYFNRVRTGWDWNKYNKTHYDHDNPPPKTIQGYKFAIFYPDLIDVAQTPKYFLEACSDTKDFAILRFHAGPPYEDIAFKIVNREWDTDRRAGFKCQFERGVLQLHVNLKRQWYRR